MTRRVLTLVKRLEPVESHINPGGLDTIRTGKRELYIAVCERPGTVEHGRILVDDADGTIEVDADVSSVGLRTVLGVRGFISAFSGTLLLHLWSLSARGGDWRERTIANTGLVLLPPQYKEG